MSVSGLVLIAEDDEEMRALLELAFRRAGFEVESHPDGLSLLKRFADVDDAAGIGEPDLIVLDHHMHRLHGLDALERLRRAGVSTPALLVTSFADLELKRRASSCGVSRIFDKPVELSALVDAALALVD